MHWRRARTEFRPGDDYSGTCSPWLQTRWSGLLGLSLGTLLSASLLVEVVMGWPGLGPLLVDSIMARDIAVVLGTVLLSAAFLIAGNLAGDLLLYRLDPRIRVR